MVEAMKRWMEGKDVDQCPRTLAVRHARRSRESIISPAPRHQEGKRPQVKALKPPLTPSQALLRECLGCERRLKAWCDQRVEVGHR